MTKRIALYYRVSTDDQTTEPQRLELHDYCARRGWPIAAEYTDTISGSKFTRAGLDQMMASVRRRRIDTIICTKLDRLGRSLPHLAQIISELDSHGVALVCTSQPIDTTDSNPAGRLTMHILMAMAEFESSLIRERTLAGLKAARAKGVRLGRPHALSTHYHDVARLRGQGMSGRQIARHLGASNSLVFKIIGQQLAAAA
jgi:DNA invertase Pin-like site-specific DNA recombinase